MYPCMRPYTAPASDRLQQISVEEQEVEDVGGALERFIAQELGNAPFDLELNAASFSYMSKDELHEILDKILETVSPEMMESIYVAENKTEKILDFLQVLRYRPAMEADNSDLERLRRGIDEADVSFFVSLMAWLLANMPTLKTRAYLSKFLTKVKLPDELFCDEEVSALYEQYEEEIEKFKNAHKERESIIKRKSLVEVKDDVALIQQDVECLRRKIDMAKAKVGRAENVGETIEVIRQVRLERQKQNDLVDQEMAELTREKEISERMDYLKATLKELRVSNESLTPKTLFEREEQEIDAGRVIIETKLPKSIGKMRRRIRGMRTVLENPPRHVNDLQDTKQKTLLLEAECKRMERVLESQNSREVSKEIAVLRKKSVMVRSRRNKLRDHLTSVQENYDAAKAKLTETSVEALAKRETKEKESKFKKMILAKYHAYKEKHAELDDLKIQLTKLRKTQENLDKDLGKNKDAKGNYVKDHDLGEGYFNLRQKAEQASMTKRVLDEQKEDVLAQYSDNVTVINKELEDRKYRLKPLLEMVEEARKQTLLLDTEHRQLKHKFAQAQLPNETESLESEVEAMKQTIYEHEMKIYGLEMDTKFNYLELQRAKEESCSRGRIRSFKERVLGKIVEQERVHRDLIQEDADLAYNELKVQEQQQMFNDLLRLLKFKKETLSLDSTSADEEELSEDDDDDAE